MGDGVSEGGGFAHTACRRRSLGGDTSRARFLRARRLCGGCAVAFRLGVLGIGVNLRLAPAFQQPLQPAVQRCRVGHAEDAIERLALACCRPARMTRFPLAQQVGDEFIPGRLLGELEPVEIAFERRLHRRRAAIAKRLVELARVALAFGIVPG